ncbi:MAG: TonB-dependent receptor [Bacteroidales bacterium]|nr:TonB-dependent receptor [Bacteroidales bacterium]
MNSKRSLKMLLCTTILACVTALGSVAEAQNLLKGKILDPSGEPVIGAAVVLSGTAKGVSTDIDGMFSIAAAAGTSADVSCIGYKSVKVALQDGMTIVLEEDRNILEDAVVVGYGVQKRESLTGSVAVMKSEMLQEKGSLSSPLQAMQGQIPGVIITRSSSAPGDESWGMSLRGAVSANGGEPLIIIDGVAYESVNEMRLLNSEDIASISFLKDGAAAIYGSRAAAGVVLITTKQGVKGRTKVEYSGSYTLKTVGLMPTLMSIDEWAEGVKQATGNDPSHTWYRYATLAQQYKGQYIDKLINADPFAGGAFGDTADFVFADNIDWLKSLFSDSHSTNHNLSISGGSDKASYRVSLGYLYDGSPLVYGNNNNQRYNFRINNKFQIFKWLSLESSIGYNRQEQVAPTNIGGMLTANVPMPGLPMFSIDGKPYAWGTWGSPAAKAVYGGDNNLHVATLNVSETFKANITKWLDANVNLGYSDGHAERETVNKSIEYYNYAGTKKTLTSPTSADSYYKSTSSRTNFYSISGYLNAHNSWSGHSVSGTLGAQYEFKSYKKMGVEAKDIQDALEVVNGSGEIKLADIDKYQFAVASVFGRLNYDYKSRYLVEFNARYDGSSKFLPENRWDFFWGASLGWNLAKEDFMKDASWLDELKIRGSYGEVGNQNGISNYDGMQLYNLNAGSGVLIGNGQATTITTNGKFASSTRQWERICNYNLGLDWGFLGNRLTGSADVFTKKNNNMLVSVDYPSIVGDTPPTVNSGKFKSWGYEGTISWRDRAGKDFHYNLGGTFTFARTQLVDLGGQATIASGFVSNREGYPLNSLFGLRYGGKIENEKMLQTYLEKYYNNNGIGMPSSLRVGDNMYCDENGDGKLDAEDYIYLGTDTPEIQYSFNAGISWKGLDFSIVFQGAAGRVMWNGGTDNWTVPLRALYVNSTNQSVGNMWSPENPDGHYCPYSTDGQVNTYNYQASSFSATDAAYLRLKNLTLGYSLSNKALGTQKVVSGCRFYFTGSDIWEISNVLEGWDPEAASQARKPNATTRYPFLRSFTFGVNLTF